MKYKTISNEEFDDILQTLVVENASMLLTIPGVHEAVSEHFNNDVLDTWKQQQEEKHEETNSRMESCESYGVKFNFDMVGRKWFAFHNVAGVVGPFHAKADAVNAAFNSWITESTN